MDNLPRTITLINKKKRSRRIIHLITKTKEKSFKFASANSKEWVLKSGFPVSIKVSYGTKYDCTNEMDCETFEELKYALQVFVKEYMEGGETELFRLNSCLVES